MTGMTTHEQTLRLLGVLAALLLAPYFLTSSTAAKVYTTYHWWVSATESNLYYIMFHVSRDVPYNVHRKNTIDNPEYLCISTLSLAKKVLVLLVSD